MGLAFNTREIDAVMPFHWSTGPVQMGGVHPYDDPRQNIQALPTPTSATGTIPLTPHLPGTRYVDQHGGGEFVYVKFTVAAILGNILAPAANIALLSNDIVVASSTASKIVTAQAYTVGIHAGDFLRTVSGTGLNQSARIVWNTATTLYLDRELPTALDATTDFLIFRPYAMALSTATVDTLVTGVATCTVTVPPAAGQEYYAWMQVGGFCPHVLTAGAIATRVGVGASTTAGKIDDASIVSAAIGAPLILASGADELIPVMLRHLC